MHPTVVREPFQQKPAPWWTRSAEGVSRLGPGHGAYLAERLAALSAETGHGEVRGRGLLLALAFTHGDASKVADDALDRGLLINAPRPDTLRFVPALTVSREEVDQMIERLEPYLA